MSMSRIQHKAFAVNTGGISAEIYDSLNEANDRRNAIIRQERDAHTQKCLDWAAGLCEHPGELRFSFEMTQSA